MLTQGDKLAAREHFERALSLGEAIWGPNAKELIRPLFLLAKTAHQTSWDSPESLATQIDLLGRAVEISAMVPPDTDLQKVSLLVALGLTLHGAGHLDAAAERLEQALRLLGEQDESHRRFILGGFVLVLAELGRHQEALVAAEELLQLYERPGSPRRAPLEVWHQVGCCLLALGRPAEAVPYFERCVAYAKTLRDPSKADEFIELLARAKSGAVQAVTPGADVQPHLDRKG